MNRYLGIVLATIASLLTVGALRADDAALLPNAIQYFMDANGRPLANGKVYFYTPSTTTAKTTWTSASKATAQANPVQLGISGRPTNPIYGDGTYRQIVKDANNNTIWDFNTASTGSGGGSSPTATGDGDLVGTIKPWAGHTAPNQYVFTYGQAISRTTYSALFTAITSAQSVFCTSGSPTLTGLADTNSFWIGMTVEVGCLAAGNSTVVSKTNSTVTLAANANVSTSVTATFFPWGRGDGSTTFNVPDLRGVVPAGNNIMGGTASSNLTTTYFGATDPNSAGALGGSQSSTLVAGNLPSHTHTSSTLTDPGHVHDILVGSSGGGSAHVTQGDNSASATVSPPVQSHTTGITISASTGTNASGLSTAFSRVQPTRTTNYIIKITPDSNSATASGVTSLGGMTGDIACGTGLSCTGNIISGTAFDGSANVGYHLTANGLGVTPTFQGFIAYNALTTRTWQAKGRDIFSVLDYGAVADGVTDNAAAFNAAIVAANTYSQLLGGTSAGTVYVPGGQACYLINSAITLLKGVNIKGDGGRASCILANDTNAIEMSFISGFDIANISNIGITGQNSTAARTAIKRIGSTTEVNTQYGLRIDGVIVNEFDTGIDITTMQNLWIGPSWFLNINQCVSLNGAVYVALIDGLNCTLGSGGGTGAVTNAGIAVNSFNYTTGGGVLKPEGIEFLHTKVHGFQIPYLLNAAVYITISNGDVSGTVNCIKWDDVTGGLFINNNYLEMIGASAASCLYGLGTGSGASAKTNIYSNYLIAAGGDITSTGIQINDAGVFGQHDVVIRDNTFESMAVRDIYVRGPNQITIRDNTAYSTGGTASIAFSSATGGINEITGNNVAVSIVVDASDVTSGAVRTCDNIVAGVRETCTWKVTTNSLADKQVVLGRGAGAQPSTLAAMTDGQIIIGATGADPTVSTMSGDATLAANGALTLASTIAAGGPTGSATVAPIITYDVKGRLTTVSSATITPAQASVVWSGTSGGIPYYNSTNTIASSALLGTNLLMQGGGAGAAPSTFTLGGDCTFTTPNITCTKTNGVTYPSSVTSGGVLYASSTSAVASSALLTANAIMIGGGAGVAPSTTTTGTAVLTALGTNVGTAGSFVVNGGALGSPSSVGTLPAHTLGGTISGGGNQINNVVIGTTTPLAGSFTTLTGTSLSVGATAIASPPGADSANITNQLVVGGNSTVTPFGSFIFSVYSTSISGIVAVNTSATSTSSGAGLAGVMTATPSAADHRIAFYTAGAASVNSAGLFFYSSEAWTVAAAQGTYMDIATTPNGSATRTVIARFQQSGGLSVGTTTDPGIGVISANRYLQSGAVAVGSLPTCNAAAKAARYFVTDSNAASYTAGIGAIVAAGGATNVPVVCDGTNWRIG